MYDYICGNCDRGHITEASAELVQCKKKKASPNISCGKWDRKKKKVPNDFCKAGEEKDKKKKKGMKGLIMGFTQSDSVKPSSTESSSL